jgi:hypothetical protein
MVISQFLTNCWNTNTAETPHTPSNLRRIPQIRHRIVDGVVVQLEQCSELSHLKRYQRFKIFYSL